MLRDAGFKIVNVACSLGREAQLARRRREVAEACRRAGFRLIYLRHDDGRFFAQDDLNACEPLLVKRVAGLIDEVSPGLIVSPSPHDRHPEHEAVGRAVVRTVLAGKEPSRLWLWNIWSDPHFATLAVEIESARVEEIQRALSAHEGELNRNDYARLLAGRSQANTVLGPEKVFGFGHPGSTAAGMELLCEVMIADGHAFLGQPRIATNGDMASNAQQVDITEWLLESSLTTRFGARRTGRGLVAYRDGGVD